MKRLHVEQSAEGLRKLILEHPDLPIVVLASEDANCGDCTWMYCTKVSFEIMEILDCDYYDYGDCVFTDRDWLKEVIEDRLLNDYRDKPEELEAAVKAKVEDLEPYWREVMAIYADN